MDFESLTFEQRIAVHELDIQALRQRLLRQERLFASMIELIGLPANSPEFFQGLRTLRIERDRLSKE